MPIWCLRSAEHLPIELDSDHENESSSSTYSSHSGVGSAGSGCCESFAGSLRGRVTVSRQLPLPGKTLEEPPFPVAAVSLDSNRFTGGATQRTIMAPVVYPFLLGSSSPAGSTHANHQSLQGVQERRVRNEHASAVSSAPGMSCRSSRGGSFALSCEALEKIETMNILVLGARQVGKSLFINSYRAAITNTTQWPSAPVGISGCYGTTTVEPFPNHARNPTWLCIDTPGCVYTAGHEALLEKLVGGMPWKTKLIGPNALTPSQIKDLPPNAANRAHQCIIVVAATDLISDEGWINTLLWRNRYRPADDVAARIFHLKSLLTTLRTLMNDASPFVVVSKMDKFGGAGSTTARATLISILTECVPVNRLYFTAAVENAGLLSTDRTIVLESSTKANLLRLHEDICLAVQWSNRMDTM
ncbi:hypothetical protein JKF63_01513 [Porcisia hertigi]|uniref:Uncharacterized protein n=1 Tax=Porcisia hertigi TaxID=2761500 RepID=A0A836I3U4_9TRYP|nr:hypothetical protein JKF63_01513 [Porcisia hertigi]